jgi:hypothetical protein
MRALNAIRSRRVHRPVGRFINTSCQRRIEISGLRGESLGTFGLGMMFWESRVT